MTDADIRWYSINQKLRVEEHEFIDLAGALKIVNGYFARGEEKFAGGEEALAATMFGFSRAKTVFIEICVHGPRQISYRFEYAEPGGPWWKRLFTRVFQHEIDLHSREELLQKVGEFFTTPAQEIRRRLKAH